MRDSAKMMAMTAMAASQSAERLSITERGKTEDTSKQRTIPIEPQQKFKDQEGIKALIKEYKLIIAGKSTKGARKRARTLRKIEQMTKNGYLQYTDIL